MVNCTVNLIQPCRLHSKWRNVTTHILRVTGVYFCSSIFGVELVSDIKTVLVIAHILPSIESSAISSDEFVGAVAEITIGRASRGNPAEAKFTDNYSQPHFVLVEPFEEKELFAQGERVILVQKMNEAG